MYTLTMRSSWKESVFCMAGGAASAERAMAQQHGGRARDVLLLALQRPLVASIAFPTQN